MSKLRRDLRVGVLGAAAGVFTVSAFLLVARIDSYYLYLAWLEENNYAQYYGGVEDLWWLPLLLGQISISVLASLVVHRYQHSILTSPFLLWQLIGFGSVVGWALSIVLALSLECVMRGDTTSLAMTIQKTNMAVVVKYVSVLFACHAFYGSLIKAATREYAE